jgi:hypothetical protein
MPAINLAQKSKTIAYAVCLNEDNDAHVHIFRAVKVEVERVINGLIDAGYTHI